MPQVTIDVVVTNQDASKLITAKIGDNEIQSELLPGEIATIDELAAWLLAQRSRVRSTDITLQKRLTIDFHTEQTTDPETGALIDQIVIDSVIPEPLPADSGRSDFQSLPGWVTWTANEAEAWIETNVTDLASAKTALKAMAKAIVYLRNVVID